MSQKKTAERTTLRTNNEPMAIEASVEFEQLLDTEQAARLLRMHPQTLRIKARSGEIPAKQVGKRWRFRASTLNHWLEEPAC